MALDRLRGRLRPRLSIEAVATLVTVTAVGMTAFLVSSQNLKLGPYLLFVFSLAMALPILTYLKSRRPENPQGSEQMAEPKSDPVPSTPARADPPQPVAPPAPAAAEATGAITQLGDQMSRIEAQLGQLVKISGSILEALSRQGAPAPPDAAAQPRPASAPAAPAAPPAAQTSPKRSVRGGGDQEDAGPEGDEPKVKLKQVKSLDEVSDTVSKAKQSPATRMEELNILREELVKLRSKLDVAETRQK